MIHKINLIAEKEIAIDCRKLPEQVWQVDIRHVLIFCIFATVFKNKNRWGRMGYNAANIVVAKEITQIIERQRPDGWWELIMVVTDTETGETKSDSTSWYLPCDRDVRVNYLRENLLK